MTFTAQATLAEDATFRGKVRVAANFAALAVVGETPLNAGEVDAKRHALGVAILADGCTAKLDAFSWALASFGTITGASSDSDIQFVVNSVFSDLAGVTGAEVEALS